jgi:hypothetical protein
LSFLRAGRASTVGWGGFWSIGVGKIALRAIFGACVHNFSAGDNIQNKLLCPDHHLDVPEVWTKRFIKETNIGFNNLHPSLDFGDGMCEFGGPANVGWTKMDT